MRMIFGAIGGITLKCTELVLQLLLTGNEG
jgi:hypothetical protein